MKSEIQHAIFLDTGKAITISQLVSYTTGAFQRWEVFYTYKGKDSLLTLECKCSTESQTANLLILELEKELNKPDYER